MKKRNLILSAIILLSIHCYSENFAIEAVKVGPNPIVQGKHDLVVNYTASTYHRAQYYLYSTTGELFFYKQINSNEAEMVCSESYTTSGDCEFILETASTMAAIPTQLYVLAMVFTSTSGNSIGDSISKKKYVIVK